MPDRLSALTLSDAIQTNMLWIQAAVLAVQVLGLLGLAAYVYFTRELLRASQAQVTVSQQLIRAGMDQVEGLSRPCLTLWADLREKADALLSVGDAVGATIAKGDDGYFVVQNIGNGPAINVSYSFEPIDPPRGKGLKGNSGYLQNVLVSQKIRMPLPISMSASGHWEATFGFESLGGRAYKTAVTLKTLVLTDFQFREIDKINEVVTVQER